MAFSVRLVELLVVECTQSGAVQVAGHAELDKQPAGVVGL